MVVIRHVLQCSTSDQGGVLGNIIWAVQMPGFMLIAGYFSYKCIDSYKTLVMNFKKNCCRYLLPFISWFFLISVILLGRFEGSLLNGGAALIQHVDNGLWFLWVTFILAIIASFVNLLMSKNNLGPGKLIVAIAFFLVFGIATAFVMTRKGISFLGIKYVLYYGVYYAIGYHVNKHNILSLLVEPKHKLYKILSAMSFSMFLFIVFNIDLQSGADNFTNILIRFFAAMSGCLALMVIVNRSSEYLQRMNVNKIGMHTLEIYCVHVYYCGIMKQENANSLYTVLGFQNFVISLFITVVATLLTIQIIRVFPFANLILFGNRSTDSNKCPNEQG